MENVPLSQMETSLFYKAVLRIPPNIINTFFSYNITLPLGDITVPAAFYATSVSVCRKGQINDQCHAGEDLSRTEDLHGFS